ncbi:MAG: hypothetical protein DMD48_14645 [Gemmatimonadetes bacterium]|nr:MAG: hypothetical protein DMD48_14645 [Gemmatimonadota bacterium]
MHERVTKPSARSRTKTSVPYGKAAGVSSATRSSAADANATKRPSALTPVLTKLSPSASPPVAVTLTSSVAPVRRSWTKVLKKEFVGGGTTNPKPYDPKTTKRASGVMTGKPLKLVPSPPVLDTLTRSVVPAWRSRTNTSFQPFLSPGTRLEAAEPKAT